MFQSKTSVSSIHLERSCNVLCHRQETECDCSDFCHH